jgi:glycosyl transferase family 25
MAPKQGLQNLDIFHTPVYVINLKQRKDRWKLFLHQDPGVRMLQLRRINAANGKALDYLKDPRISPYTRLNIMRNDRRTHHEIATLGAVGCSISHASIWKRIVESGAPYAVVMEDDARFTTEQLQQINTLAKTIPTDAGIWLFGAFKPNMVYDPLPNNSPWSRVYQFTASHAYVITRDAAKQLLAQVFPVEMHIDHYMSTMTVLYDIPMLIHKDLHIGFGGIMEASHAARALESNTSQHKKDGCSACHVPDHLSRFYNRVGPRTRKGRIVHGIRRPKLDKRVLTYRKVKVRTEKLKGGGEDGAGGADEKHLN